MEQEALYRFSVEHALEMVIAFGEDGRIGYVNQTAKRLLEYGDELCGINISDIFPNAFTVTDYGFSTEYRFGEEAQDMMAYRKNHTCFSVSTRILKMEETPAAYLCMAEDTSKQNFLEKQVVQVEHEASDAMKVKSEFVANVTHELRTPVNGILGNTKELLERETDADKLKIMRLIERGCRDMNSIINNILDFSKLEAGKFTLETRKFEFRSMMDYVKSNHINKITEKGLEFFVTISPEVPEFVIGDELRIVQILNNLLSNACKFTAVGKIVVEVVKTAQLGNRAELFFLVIDTGIGIDKSQQDKLFKSFSQVDASISRKYGGTGLGLNISKQLVELMGGNITAQSEPNKGTMFSFSIWLELLEEEAANPTVTSDIYTVIGEAKNSMSGGEGGDIHQYGTQRNREEIGKIMPKLILSVEMDNWEKAEMFMDVLKQLTEDAPREIKTAVLKMKMAVQKGNYDKTAAAYETLEHLFEES